LAELEAVEGDVRVVFDNDLDQFEGEGAVRLAGAADPTDPDMNAFSLGAVVGMHIGHV